MMAPIPPAELALLAKQDQGPKVIALVVSFTVLSLICVLLRFVARIKFTRLMGWEDYFIALSMVFSILTAICQVKQVQSGSGKHQMFVDLPSTINSLRYLYFSILGYCFGFTLIKVSILTQYRRIFSVQKAILPIYIVMGLCVATGVAALFTFAFTCRPVDAFWDVRKKSTAKCINDNAARYAHGIFNIVTDLLIAALPVRDIWQLQLVRRQKIALLAILTVGWCVCIISILRLHSLVVLARNEQDAMFYGAPPIYWAAIEMNLAIVCACFPALKPLIVKFSPAFASRPSGYDSGQPFSATKPSKFARSSRTTSNKSGSSFVKSIDVGQGFADTELGAVPAVPLTHWRHPEIGHILITREVDQKSDRRPSDGSSQRLVLQGTYSRI